MFQHQGREDDVSLRPKGSRIDAEVDDQQTASGTTEQVHPFHPGALLGLQRSAGNSAVSSMLEEEEPSPVHDVVSSPGRPLDPEVRTDMEGRLGADFGDVRVHDDPAAQASATAVDANAYTVGTDVVFQRDHYDPGSAAGRTTLAHELTHVIQQRNGSVDGNAAQGGIKISDPSDRFEREAAANADRVMSSEPAAGGPPVQRDQSTDETEEDETVQGLFVQRQAVEEEEEPEESAERVSDQV